MKGDWVVPWNGGSQGEKEGISGNKYGVPQIPPWAIPICKYGVGHFADHAQTKFLGGAR